MNIVEFLEEHDACEPGIDWVKAQSDQSIETLWKTCDDGSWMIWFHEACGTDFNTLAPVVYRAVNRALRHAEKALDDAGIDHNLAGVTVTDQESAASAASAARAARAARAASAAVSAARAVEAASAAELKQIADDCRELLPVPKMEVA